MKSFDTSSGSSHVSVDSLEGISSDSSSLDVNLLDLNSSSEDDTSCSEDENDRTTSGLSGQHDSGSRGEVSRKPPPLQLPHINIPHNSIRLNTEHVKESARSSRTRRGVCTESEETFKGPAASGSHVRVSVDLLTPAFDIVVPSWEEDRNSEALRLLRSNCAEKFGIRSDRINLYELSSVVPDGNGSLAIENDAMKVGIEIVGSEFTLEKLEEIMQARDNLQREKRSKEEDSNANLQFLQGRVAELERKLLLSETMRLKAHNALQELRHEIDLLESSLQDKT